MPFSLSSAMNKVVSTLSSVEDEVSETLCDLLPDPLRDALAVTQRNPWRTIVRESSRGSVNLMPLLLPPFTFPLAVVQVPLLLFLEINRLGFNVIANCGRVSQVMKNEACDLTLVLESISPNRPEGRAMRQLLQLAGFPSVVETLDAWRVKALPVLRPLCQGQTPKMSDMTQFAMTSAQITGDPEVISAVTSGMQSLDQMEQTEAQLISAASQLGLLSDDVEPMTEAGNITAMSIPGPTGRRKKKSKKDRKKAARVRAVEAAAGKELSPAEKEAVAREVDEEDKGTGLMAALGVGLVAVVAVVAAGARKRR